MKVVVGKNARPQIGSEEIWLPSADDLWREFERLRRRSQEDIERWEGEGGR